MLEQMNQCIFPVCLIQSVSSASFSEAIHSPVVFSCPSQLDHLIRTEQEDWGLHINLVLV